jgi:hypothetical protein
MEPAPPPKPLKTPWAAIVKGADQPPAVAASPPQGVARGEASEPKDAGQSRGTAKDAGAPTVSLADVARVPAADPSGQEAPKPKGPKEQPAAADAEKPAALAAVTAESGGAVHDATGAEVRAR